MRTAYRVLAYLVCGLVALQAASHAWASAGIALFLAEGGSLDPSAGLPNFPEALGLMIHGMNGMYVIPLVALALLVVSFFARLRAGVLWAGIVLALTLLQVVLGLMGHELTALAFLHGVNALLLFGAALTAALRAPAPAPAETAAPRTTVGVG